MASVARNNDYGSFTKIWNDPDNAQLRQQRETPHVLLPGDQVAIPEKNVVKFRRDTGSDYTFTVWLPPFRLRAKLFDLFNQPLANVEGELTAGGVSQTVQTDGDAMLEADVPYASTRVILRIDDDTQFELALGNLDPVDEPSGQQARLLALGYFMDTVVEAGASKKEQDAVSSSFKLAWELFQDENGLEVTGEGDADSVDKLREIYGC